MCPFYNKIVTDGLKYSATAVISHHLSSYISKDAGVIQIIQDSLYVDDLVCGESSVEKAFKIYQSAKRMMLEGGFNLRKWNSNSNELLRRIQIAESMLDDSPSHKPTSTGVITEEEESYAKSITSNCMTTDFSKVLGVIWDSNSDDFMFDFFELVKYARSLPPSKRSLLRVTAKIFDPLGLLAPFVIRLKALFQLLCMNKCGWDDPLQGELHDHWTRILTKLGSISRIRIPRCYFLLNSSPTDVQLHGFSDAS